jgi:hypothetical protein
MSKKWMHITGGVIGAGIVFVALFANQLGLDNNPVWGIKRWLAFFLGTFILTAAIFHREHNVIGRYLHTRTGQMALAVASLSTAIIFVYVWYVSIGLWTSWPNEMSYYNLLAAAFHNGQTAVDVAPEPALLALENPFEPRTREGIPLLWDATLYNGKYYLYWGPTPALLLAFFKLFSPQDVGDKVITFLFTVGTFLFAVLLILELWKKYFTDTPRWAILLGIACMGLVNPMLYILIEARIYEAAIISGQFFLLGGLYWLFTAFDTSSRARFALSGLFLALAVGSRTTLVPAIAFLSLTMLVWAVKTRRDKVITLTLTFALPLVIGAMSYGWYNLARFGSAAEFGLRYQITSYNLYESLDETFSPAYIPPNVYKTLFNSLERREIFPYYFPTRWSGPDALEREYPRFYLLLGEGITGILVASPFLIFAFPAWLNKDKNFRWIVLALTGSSLLTFLMLQIFFFTTMRYLLDLIPALSLLAVTGFWQLLSQSKPSRLLWWTLSITGIVLVAYSIVISLILPISGHMEAFRVFNPELLKQLSWTFNSILK